MVGTCAFDVRSCGVVRVGPDDGIERDRDIGDRAGERAAAVLTQRERHDAGAAGQTDSRAQADELVIGRRHPDRAAGVGAEAERRHVRRDRRPRAARRAARGAAGAGGPVGAVHVQRRAGGRSEAERRRCVDRELVHAGLGEDDRVVGTKALDHERVVCGLVQRPARAARRSGHVHRVVVVFEHDRDAVEEAARPVIDGARGVALGRGRQRVGARPDDRVERLRRSGLDGVVVGGDPVEIGLRQLYRGHDARRSSRPASAGHLPRGA